MKTITWRPVKVAVSKIKPGPNQFKIKTELGRERLKTSMRKFGHAGTLVLNADFTIIDGHSRFEEAKLKKEKEVWASIPDRKLTPKEYTEFNALFDYASASEVDINRIHGELGTAADFRKEWSLAVPQEILDQIGKGGRVNSTSVNGGATKEAPKSDTRIINIIMNPQQEAAILQAEAICAKRFKTDNITDTVMAALIFVSKLKK